MARRLINSDARGHNSGETESLLNYSPCHHRENTELHLKGIPGVQTPHRNHFMVFRASPELIQSLRVTLQKIDEVFPSQADEPFVAELRRVVLLRIAELESADTDEPNSMDEPEVVQRGRIDWLRLRSG